MAKETKTIHNLNLVIERQIGDFVVPSMCLYRSLQLKIIIDMWL